jgi:hypothetical protein
MPAKNENPGQADEGIISPPKGFRVDSPKVISITTDNY